MKKWMLILCAGLLALMLSGCSCKHESTGQINVKDATCEEAGYTGDTYCFACEKVLAKGSATDPVGHTASEPLYAREGTCQEPGYTGDIYCTRCQTVLEQGQSTELGDHVLGDFVENEPTCEEDGWYSRVDCKICGETIREEQTLDALGHDIPDPFDYVEPTCTEKGYSGDGLCNNCNEWVEGKTLPTIPHPYDHGICTVCGHQQPGLFNEDHELVMSWEDLIDQELLLIDDIYSGDYNDIVYGISDQLTGTLVVTEGYDVVVYDPRYWQDTVNQGMACNLTRIIFPKGSDELNYTCLYGLSNLESVEITGQIFNINRNAFAQCINLKSVSLPDTITRIQNFAFKGASSLESIELGEAMLYLSQACFEGCTSLTEVVLPASVTHVESLSFSGCTSLKRVVVNCALEKASDPVFADCPALEEIVFSANCNKTNFKMFKQIKENAFTIYYGGTEADWTALGGNEYFPNATVTFNYTGE